MIFVFGSNEAGHHGAGAARVAVEKYGAVHGHGIGRRGKSYAIPTKDEQVRTLPLRVVRAYVNVFLLYAERLPYAGFPDTGFQVTRIGCGLAGYTDAEIAPLFFGAPRNCTFDTAWKSFLGTQYAYWGTYP